MYELKLIFEFLIYFLLEIKLCCILSFRLKKKIYTLYIRIILILYFFVVIFIVVYIWIEIVFVKNCEY